MASPLVQLLLSASGHRNHSHPCKDKPRWEAQGQLLAGGPRGHAADMALQTHGLSLAPPGSSWAERAQVSPECGTRGCSVLLWVHGAQKASWTEPWASPHPTTPPCRAQSWAVLKVFFFLHICNTGHRVCGWPSSTTTQSLSASLNKPKLNHSLRNCICIGDSLQKIPKPPLCPKVAQAKPKSLLTDNFPTYFELGSQRLGKPPVNPSYA